jgi:hypothetical protein
VYFLLTTLQLFAQKRVKSLDAISGILSFGVKTKSTGELEESLKKLVELFNRNENFRQLLISTPTAQVEQLTKLKKIMDIIRAPLPLQAFTSKTPPSFFPCYLLQNMSLLSTELINSFPWSRGCLTSFVS